MSDKICVVGLGYVGLPLTVAFAKKNSVFGFDVNHARVKELISCFDETLEVDEETLNSVKENIIYTNNIEDASECNIYIITVPTPITQDNKPDLSYLVSASKSVGLVIHKGDIVIYESTVYPGVTEEICVPILEQTSNLKYNKDFYCGYSPERISPGDKVRKVENIVKVTSGSTPEVAITVDRLYQSIITAGTYLASSIRVAEASKVIENIQRDVNIALINELALIFGNMGIDTREVLEAAETKWNFINFQPGLVGGHCIGVDPYYLTYKAEELGYSPDLILAARQINNGMGKYIANQTIKCMINEEQTINNSDILILGVTFKEDCPDVRNTRVIDIIKELNRFGANVNIYDPLANYESLDHSIDYKSIENPLNFNRKYDAIIVAVAHNEFKKIRMNDYIELSKGNLVLIDVKGIVEDPTWRL